MIKYISVFLILLAAACAPKGEEVNGSRGAVRRIHDDEMGVNCWIVYQGQVGVGISCIPDNQLPARYDNEISH